MIVNKLKAGRNRLAGAITALLREGEQDATHWNCSDPHLRHERRQLEAARDLLVQAPPERLGMAEKIWAAGAQATPEEEEAREARLALSRQRRRERIAARKAAAGTQVQGERSHGEDYESA